MALIRPIPKSSMSDIVMLAITGNTQVSANRLRGMSYTDNNKIISNLPSGTWEISGTDFSGTLSNISSSTITVIKAGTYEINNNGTITSETYSANSSITIPVLGDAPSSYWNIRKIS